MEGPNIGSKGLKIIVREVKPFAHMIKSSGPLLEVTDNLQEEVSVGKTHGQRLTRNRGGNGRAVKEGLGALGIRPTSEGGLTRPKVQVESGTVRHGNPDRQRQQGLESLRSRAYNSPIVEELPNSVGGDIGNVGEGTGSLSNLLKFKFFRHNATEVKQRHGSGENRRSGTKRSGGAGGRRGRGGA